MGELDTQTYMISAFWDADASVWVASSNDVPGLVTEADTIELLVAKLKVLIPDLLEANGILPKAYDSVPFHLHVDQGVKSRHTANGMLKQAGLPKAF